MSVIVVFLRPLGLRLVDLFYEGGISNMRYSVSNTAEYGDLTRGPRVVNASVKAEMKKILDEMRALTSQEYQKVIEAGGLHVLGTERQVGS